MPDPLFETLADEMLGGPRVHRRTVFGHAALMADPA